MFKQIGRADELGSVVRNVFRYGKIYGKQEPEFIEHDIFKTIVYYFHSDVGKNVRKDVRKKEALNHRQIRILNMIMSGKELTAKEVKSGFEMSEKPIERDLTELKKNGFMKI